VGYFTGPAHGRETSWHLGSFWKEGKKRVSAYTSKDREATMESRDVARNEPSALGQSGVTRKEGQKEGQSLDRGKWGK